jgi:hypothetical protein
MTKTKKAIKEVNQMADKAILKAQFDAYKAKAKDWLAVEVYGHKRGTILVAVIVMIAAVITAS